jgi:hypothetical protein
MTTPDDYVWTERQFEEMSWHDNHVHAIRIEEGEHGAGKLILDLDYILEWVKDARGVMRFSILPVALVFREVTSLRMTLDYATPTAAMGPFSIRAIERRTERRQRYTALLWNIVISWPSGEITFEAPGYEQRGAGKPILADQQCLRPQVRAREA